MSDVLDRMRGTIAGLAVGDGLAWPSWWHRLASLSPKREARLVDATQFARGRWATGFPTPYLQSSPPTLVDPAGPTDDAEWFVVTARSLLGQSLDRSAAEPLAVWSELAAIRAREPRDVRARLGTLMALDNISAGSKPPASGHDNAHYFDDIACVRAVAAGLLHVGSPEAASAAAELDASVTHSLDGVWAARGVAALIAELCNGVPSEAAVSAAVSELPDASWVAHVVTEMLDRARRVDDTLGLAMTLERTVVDHTYSYSTTAPETLGLALAHLTTASSPESLILAGLAHPRHADGLVPLCAALAGAGFGTSWLPADVVRPLPRLRGIAVRELAGAELETVFSDLVDRGKRAQ